MKRTFLCFVLHTCHFHTATICSMKDLLYWNWFHY